MKTWLVIDVSYCCYRAFHTLGDLSYRGVKTGVVYGFLRSLTDLTERFQTKNLVFCFDRGRPLRCDILPSYKEKRKERRDENEEMRTAREHIKVQMKMLRKVYLPQIGYKNICSQNGYEADDMIASVVQNIGNDEAIIVSADHDLYQLLSHNVSVFHPQLQKIITYKSFWKTHGVTPEQWATVKAIAGCPGDGVPSIAEGIAEKTAIKLLLGQMKETTKAFQAYQKNKSRIQENLTLVQLPFKGTKTFHLVEDEFNEDGWRQVCAQLGLASLANNNRGIKRFERGKRKTTDTRAAVRSTAEQSTRKETKAEQTGFGFF